jgi:hypothetical protein
LRSRTHFRLFRGLRVLFSFLASSYSFSKVPWASGPVFMSYVLGLVLRARTHFQRYRGRWVSFSCFALSDSYSAVPRASGLVFMFCAPELIFGGTYGVGSRFHFLRSRTLFLRCGGRRVPFSCFELTDSFSSVLLALGPVFLFCVPVLIFDGSEGVGCRFNVLRSRTNFRRYRGRRVPF